MFDSPGSRATFVIERSEAKRRAEPDRTMSKDAVEALGLQFQRWVLSRLMRRWRDSGRPPQGMEVEVNVKLDGVEDEGLTFRVIVPDGGHRQRAAGG